MERGKQSNSRMSNHEYESGGLKLIDIDCMIKSLRLAWLQNGYLMI